MSEVQEALDRIHARDDSTPNCEDLDTIREALAALATERDGLRAIARLIVDGAMPATASGATCFVPRYQIDKLRDAIAKEAS